MKDCFHRILRHKMLNLEFWIPEYGNRGQQNVSNVNECVFRVNLVLFFQFIRNCRDTIQCLTLQRNMKAYKNWTCSTFTVLDSHKKKVFWALVIWALFGRIFFETAEMFTSSEQMQRIWWNLCSSFKSNFFYD